MNEALKRGYNHFNLLLFAAVALFFSLSGCSGPLPEIEITPDSETLLATGPKSANYKVLPFRAAGSNVRFVRLVSEYLTQQIAEKQPLSAQKPVESHPGDEKPRMNLSGKVKITNWATLSDPSKTAIKTEITFEISDQNGSIINSTMLAKNVFQATDEDIHSALRHTVDLYLARLFPVPVTFTVRLADGKSKFDRLGREAAARGDYPAAMTYFIQAVDARPDDHAALYNAAIICQVREDYPGAFTYVKRALLLADKIEYRLAYQRIQLFFN